MAYPNGLSLAVITSGNAFSAFGADEPLTVEVTPVFPKPGGGTLRRIVHEPSGWVMSNQTAQFKANAGGGISFSVPHVDQTGFRDPAGNVYTGWHYKVKTTLGSGRNESYENTVRPVTGQALVDLDLVPEGEPGSSSSVPAPAVTSVGGFTGAVTAAQLESLGLGGASGVDPTVVDDRAVQADYVSLLEAGSSTDGVQVVRQDGEALQVVCHSPTGQYVTHLIEGTNASSGRDDYRIVGDIFTGKLPLLPRNYNHLTRTGTYVATADQYGYTTQVGATFDLPVTIPYRGTEVRFFPYKDNRGGMWRLTLAGRSVDVSTWSASGAQESNGFLVSPPDIPAGNYTLHGEFLGADPVNAPAGGVAARGWLARTPLADGTTTTYPGTYDVVKLPDASGGWAQGTKQGVESNREFAWWCKPAGSTATAAWVPYHGTDTAFEAEPAKFYDGDSELNVFRMTVGEARSLSGPFKLVQHVIGRLPGEPDMLEVWTTTTIHPSGRMTIEGRVKVLVDIEVTNTYVIMAPYVGTLFDTAVSSWGNAYPNTAAQAGTNTWLPESDVASSFLFLSSATPRVAAAFRYNNPVETTRRGGSNKSAVDRRSWLEHRTGNTILKHYQKLWDTGAVVPAGTSHRFSGDYIHAEIPQAYGQYAV